MTERTLLTSMYAVVHEDEYDVRVRGERGLAGIHLPSFLNALKKETT
jgi:hypothetical protein